MSPRITYGLLLICLIMGGCDDLTPPEATVRLIGYEYRSYLPKDYETRDDWPLILFLHGAGQGTQNPEAVTAYAAVPRYAVENKDFPFVVIAPQSLAGDTWISERLLDLLDEVTVRFRVDTDRIYVTGLSMGGFGTFLLAAEAPERLAAVAPIAGGGRPEDACNMKDVPTWVFHNSGDEIVPVIQSEAMVAALEACQGNVRFTRYERFGHDAWSDTYFGTELYDWFLSHRLSDRR